MKKLGLIFVYFGGIILHIKPCGLLNANPVFVYKKKARAHMNCIGMQWPVLKNHGNNASRNNICTATNFPSLKPLMRNEQDMKDTAFFSFSFQIIAWKQLTFWCIQLNIANSCFGRWSRRFNAWRYIMKLCLSRLWVSAWYNG